MRITFATQLTLVRMVALPFFIIAFSYHNTVIVFIIFTLAALTDLFDGMVARYWGQKTVLGAVLDPIADKLLLNTGYVMMTYGVEHYTVKIPPWLTVMILSRDFLILLGALIFLLFANERNFRPSLLGKLTTAVQAITLFLALGFNMREYSPDWLTDLFRVVFVLTLAAGLQYAWRSVQWLNNTPSTGSRP